MREAEAVIAHTASARCATSMARIGVLIAMALIAIASGLLVHAPSAGRAVLPVEKRSRHVATTAMALDGTPRKGLWGPDREPPACT